MLSWVELIVYGVTSALGGGGLASYLTYRIQQRQLEIQASDQDLEEIRAGRDSWKDLVEDLRTRVERLEKSLQHERRMRIQAELVVSRYRIREDRHLARHARLKKLLQQHQEVPEHLRTPIETPNLDADLNRTDYSSIAEEEQDT